LLFEIIHIKFAFLLDNRANRFTVLLVNRVHRTNIFMLLFVDGDHKFMLFLVNRANRLLLLLVNRVRRKDIFILMLVNRAHRFVLLLVDRAHRYIPLLANRALICYCWLTEHIEYRLGLLLFEKTQTGVIGWQIPDICVFVGRQCPQICVIDDQQTPQHRLMLLLVDGALIYAIAVQCRLDLCFWQSPQKTQTYVMVGQQRARNTQIYVIVVLDRPKRKLSSK
jgi:hypothetical protein